MTSLFFCVLSKRWTTLLNNFVILMETSFNIGLTGWFEEWLTSAGLLHSFQVCDNCGGRMKFEKRTWICYKRACREGHKKPQKGLRAKTFFEHAELSPKQVFKLSYLWLQGRLTVDDTAYETKISHKTIVHWWEKFRAICRGIFWKVLKNVNVTVGILSWSVVIM